MVTPVPGIETYNRKPVVNTEVIPLKFQLDVNKRLEDDVKFRYQSI